MVKPKWNKNSNNFK